jgi:hypothetical protein
MKEEWRSDATQLLAGVVANWASTDSDAVRTEPFTAGRSLARVASWAEL